MLESQRFRGEPEREILGGSGTGVQCHSWAMAIAGSGLLPASRPLPSSIQLSKNAPCGALRPVGASGITDVHRMAEGDGLVKLVKSFSSVIPYPSSLIPPGSWLEGAGEWDIPHPSRRIPHGEWNVKSNAHDGGARNETFPLVRPSFPLGNGTSSAVLKPFPAVVAAWRAGNVPGAWGNEPMRRRARRSPEPAPHSPWGTRPDEGGTRLLGDDRGLLSVFGLRGLPHLAVLLPHVGIERVPAAPANQSLVARQRSRQRWASSALLPRGRALPLLRHSGRGFRRNLEAVSFDSRTREPPPRPPPVYESHGAGSRRPGSCRPRRGAREKSGRRHRPSRRGCPRARPGRARRALGSQLLPGRRTAGESNNQTARVRRR